MNVGESSQQRLQRGNGNGPLLRMTAVSTYHHPRRLNQMIGSNVLNAIRPNP
jgi:hypothetical protein